MHHSDHPEYESFISFVCPVCQAENHDVIGVLWRENQAVTADGEVSVQEQTYCCGRCLHKFTLFIRNLGVRVVIQLREFPYVDVRASQAYWSEEIEDFDLDFVNSLAQPYSDLVETISDVLEVIRSPHAEFFGPVLGRMAFIQLFAAMEAFLTDTLLGRVLSDRDRLARVLAGVSDLKAIKLCLADVLDDPEIVQRRVAAEIHKMSFHNFNKVDAVWNVAFGHSIFKNHEVRERLLSYVDIRHDCVHRNGKSENGVLQPVDYALVREVAHYFEGTALHIEGQFEGVDFEVGILDEDPPLV